MDKIRPILEFLKKEYFWVLTGLLAIVGLVGVTMASGKIGDDFQKFQTEINRRHSSLQSITGTHPHPNEKVIQGQLLEARKRSNDVAKQWNKLYNAQREGEGKVLVWPEELGDRFLKRITSLDFGQDILPRSLRETYHGYVKRRFAELHKIVRSQQPQEQEAGGRTTQFRAPVEGAGGDMGEEDFIVFWADQADLQQNLTWPSTPNSMQVWVAQENLWIYETLLRAVAAINKNVERRDQARISEIVKLEVGQQASASSLTETGLLMPEGKQLSAPGGEAGGDFMIEPERSYEIEGGFGGEQETGTAGIELLDGRYFDAAGKPIRMDPKNPSPKDSVNAVPEYKRIPIRLVLRMDQSRIPDVIIKCANSALPVEIERVQARFSGIDESQDSGGRRGAFGGSRRSYQPGEQSVHSDHSEVVFQGIVYIFNPVNKDVLEVVGIDEDAAREALKSQPPEESTSPEEDPETPTPDEDTPEETES